MSLPGSAGAEPAASEQATPRLTPREPAGVTLAGDHGANLAPRTDESARLPITARGSYEVAGKFAQGGIGRILRAHDPVLGRTVALKELLVAGRATDEQRFVREVLLTARLQHPGIVPVYAAGRWPSGEPFYAMKLVSGRSFDQVIAGAGDLAARLALLPHVLAIAETLAYAHAQGIIHRDLKPNNVLVGEFGETVVIDWGLAKQLGEPDDPSELATGATSGPVGPDTAQLTRVGAVVGTPGFMSPEQADSAPVDERTDVYALGVILYQTLTGKLPHEADNAVELLVKTVYADPVPLQEREPQAPDELAAIVDKAMARDPAARYPAAKAFADDLRRFQTGQIVGAHRYTAWELLLRIFRRHRTPLAVAAVALLIVIVTVMISFRSVAHQRDLAITAEADARTAEAEALQARNQAIERADYLALAQARLRVDNDPGLALDLLHRTSPGADWRRIRQIAAAVQQRGIPTVLHGHRAAISRAVFSPDSARLATTSDDCTVRVWNLSDRSSRAFYGHTDEVWRAAWSPDQTRLATTSRDRTVRVWDLETGAAQVLRGHASGIRNVTFGPDGRTLYSGDDVRVVLRWDLETGEHAPLDSCVGSAFAWDERRIACIAEADNEVHVHDLRTGELTRLRTTAKLGTNGSLSPDGRWVAASTTDAGVALWDRHTGRSEVLRLTRPEDEAGGLPREVRFSADSSRLLVPMARNLLATYDMSRAKAEVFRPHIGYTRRAVFSPDASLIASVGGDIGVKLSNRADLRDRSLVGAQALMIDVQFSRDSRHLASVGNDPRVFVWPERVYREPSWRMPGEHGGVFVADAPAAAVAALTRGLALTVLDTRTLRPRLDIALTRPLAVLAITGDGERVAGIDADRTLRVWDARDGALLGAHPLPQTSGVCRLHPMPDARHAGLGCSDGGVHWLDLETGALVEIARVPEPLLAVEPSRGHLLFGDREGRLFTWDPVAGASTVLHSYGGLMEALVSVPGHPQAVTSSDRVVEIWDLQDGRHWPLAGHTLQVNVVDVSADARRVATSGRDNLLRVYDRERGELLRTIVPTTLLGTALRLSPDGETLATSTHDHSILLWDLGGEPSTSLEPRVLGGHALELRSLRFAADGSSLLSIDADGRAIRWADDLPRDPAGVRAWVAAHHDPEAATPAMRAGCVASPDPAG